VPVYPTQGVDTEEIRRVQVVFREKPWTAIQIADLFQFGYDLSYFTYLDLAGMAYYMPALVIHSMTNLDILEWITSPSAWIKADAPLLGITGGNVWQCWNDIQRQWVAICLEIVAVYGIAHLDDNARITLQERMQEIFRLMFTPPG
jgi:hypothetical protein